MCRGWVLTSALTNHTNALTETVTNHEGDDEAKVLSLISLRDAAPRLDLLDKETSLRSLFVCWIPI